MPSDYRKSFVRFNMLLVGIVLLVSVAVQGAYMCRSSYEELKGAMTLMTEPWDGPSGGFVRVGGGAPEQPRRGRGREAEGLADGSVFAVFYDSSTGELSAAMSGGFLSDDELREAVDSIMEAGEGVGKLPSKGLLYYRADNGRGSKIALADSSYLNGKYLRTVLLLGGVYVLSMGVVWLISVKLSKLAAKPMEDAVELERQFVADISHDLKTPIAVIMANNSVLRSDPEAPAAEREQWTRSTDDAARGMMEMIDEMLELSSLESAGQQAKIEDVDLSAAAEKAALQLESIAFEKGVELSSEIPEGINVRGDRRYVERICRDLADNAVKYEPAGGRVDITVSEEDRRALLRVRNRGSYIPPEDIDRIFERFYRGDKSRGGQKGHGLGLPIVRRMAEMMGAEVAASSSREEGTLFTVSFTRR